MPGQNEAYDTGRPPKKFQGNPTCARPNLRWTTMWIVVGRRCSKINHPWGQNEANDIGRPPKKLQGNPTCAQPNVRRTTTWIAVGSLPRSFKAIRVGHLAVDHVDRRPSKINESWVNFFSMQNLMCICCVKMKPLTQGNLRRSFRAIQLVRGQIFDKRRRGSLSVHMLGQNEAYVTRKHPKKFQGNPTCARPNLRWTTTWITVGRRR
ncbi:uncharacterized protein G2W53_026910 [Senna tora]|uniref:Uncharacterized protein n=1 Tax=Senna tora TaxID=362788 RepID=A0A834TIC8_9FABA|nr:uncharacterized protein G2W53_026910 [Senna tora]